MTLITRIIPHLCGLLKQMRMDRRLYMFKVFIDESGNDPNEATLVVAALMGRTEEWEKFADEWLLALEADNPKPLALYKGERYFKHSEARGCYGCFAGFSDSQAEEKTINLVSVLTRYDVSAYDLTLERKLYFRLADEMIVRKSGRYYKDYVKDPLFMSLSLLVQTVLEKQYAINPTDNVDFILDSGGASERVIAVLEEIRKCAHDWLPPIMGALLPMNDKKVMPLQAVDLLAGQIRMAFEYHNQMLFKPMALLRQMDRYSAYFIGEPHIRGFLSSANMFISDRRLAAAKEKGDKEREK